MLWTVFAWPVGCPEPARTWDNWSNQPSGKRVIAGRANHGHVALNSIPHQGRKGRRKRLGLIRVVDGRAAVAHGWSPLPCTFPDVSSQNHRSPDPMSWCWDRSFPISASAMFSGGVCCPSHRWMSFGGTGKSKMWCKILEPLSRGFLVWLECLNCWPQ